MGEGHQESEWYSPIHPCEHMNAHEKYVHMRLMGSCRGGKERKKSHAFAVLKERLYQLKFQCRHDDYTQRVISAVWNNGAREEQR